MFYEFYFGYEDRDLRFFRVFADKPFNYIFADFNKNFHDVIIWDVCLCDSEGYVDSHIKWWENE